MPLYLQNNKVKLIVHVLTKGDENVLKYECITCNRIISIQKNKNPPICCGKPMKKNMPLEICIQPAHAESARPMEAEDACDDFRAGT